jgi:hypothetical protein
LVRHTRIIRSEEVTVMTDIRALAETPRSATEVQVAWDAVERLYLRDPTVPSVAGARAAAEWTTGRAAMSPISNVREDPAGERLHMEGHEAGMVAMGVEPGDRAFAAGVMAWMFWWIGLEPLPAWIRVHG